MATAVEETLTHQLTHRDLEYTPDDGHRYEIIDGELYTAPLPTYRHENAVSELVAVLRTWVNRHHLGNAFGPGLKVVLDEPSGVGPDLTYISTARMTAMRDDGYYGAPDLVVEVLSSKPQLDRFVKFRKYASAGVPHYWIVDPDRRTLEAYRLTGGRYELAAQVEGAQSFEPELFPGLAIALGDLWV